MRDPSESSSASAAFSPADVTPASTETAVCPATGAAAYTASRTGMRSTRHGFMRIDHGGHRNHKMEASEEPRSKS